MEKENSLVSNKHKPLGLQKSLVMREEGEVAKIQLLSFNYNFTTKERNYVYLPQY